ncbi:hypothetical protein HK098_005142 [Nowakowskiella sp. JEL0407]|nr:hypothetical protein HK098_005142 [Nowakowskiella sp. JEL0407]
MENQKRRNSPEPLSSSLSLIIDNTLPESPVLASSSPHSPVLPQNSPMKVNVDSDLPQSLNDEDDYDDRRSVATDRSLLVDVTANDLNSVPNSPILVSEPVSPILSPPVDASGYYEDILKVLTEKLSELLAMNRTADGGNSENGQKAMSEFVATAISSKFSNSIRLLRDVIFELAKDIKNKRDMDSKAKAHVSTILREISESVTTLANENKTMLTILYTKISDISTELIQLKCSDSSRKAPLTNEDNVVGQDNNDAAGNNSFNAGDETLFDITLSTSDMTLFAPPLPPPPPPLMSMSIIPLAPFPFPMGMPMPLPYMMPVSTNSTSTNVSANVSAKASTAVSTSSSSSVVRSIPKNQSQTILSKPTTSLPTTDQKETLAKLSKITTHLDTLSTKYDDLTKVSDCMIPQITSAVMQSVSAVVDKGIKDLEKVVKGNSGPATVYTSGNKTATLENRGQLSAIKECVEGLETQLRRFLDDLVTSTGRMEKNVMEKFEQVSLEIAELSERVDDVKSFNEKAKAEVCREMKNSEQNLAEKVQDSDTGVFEVLEELGERYNTNAEVDDSKFDTLLKSMGELKRRDNSGERIEEVKRIFEYKMDLMERRIMDQLARMQTSIDKAEFSKPNTTPLTIRASANEDSCKGLFQAPQPRIKPGPSQSIQPPTLLRDNTLLLELPVPPVPKQDLPSLTVSSTQDLAQIFPPIEKRKRGRPRKVLENTSNENTASSSVLDSTGSVQEKTGSKDKGKKVMKSHEGSTSQASSSRTVENQRTSNKMKHDEKENLVKVKQEAITQRQEITRMKQERFEESKQQRSNSHQRAEKSQSTLMELQPKRRRVNAEQSRSMMTLDEIAKVKKEAVGENGMPESAKKSRNKWRGWILVEDDEDVATETKIVKQLENEWNYETPKRSAAMDAMRKMQISLS